MSRARIPAATGPGLQAAGQGRLNRFQVIFAGAKLTGQMRDPGPRDYTRSGVTGLLSGDLHGAGHDGRRHG